MIAHKVVTGAGAPLGVLFVPERTHLVLAGAGERRHSFAVDGGCLTWEYWGKERLGMFYRRGDGDLEVFGVDPSELNGTPGYLWLPAPCP